MRALAEQLFSQTRYHMLIAIEADPTLEIARATRQEADERLCEIRFANALEMQASGHYRAALREFLSVEAEHPEHEGLAERLDVVKREVEASKLGRQGEVALFRGDYAKARELIDRAFELSSAERARYNDLLLLTREREFDEKYIAAKDLEFNGDLLEAVERYREIDAEMSGFLDVKARLFDLEASIDAATVSYQAGVAAETAGKSDEARAHYEDAALHYPGFRDIEARLRRLPE